MGFDSINNPFFDQWKNFMDVNSFAKNFSGFNMDSMSNMISRNIEVLTSTNQKAIEQINNLWLHAMDAMQKNTNEVVSAFQEMMSSCNFDKTVSKQQKVVSNIVTNTMDSAKKAFQNVVDTTAATTENIMKNTTKKN